MKIHKYQEHINNLQELEYIIEGIDIDNINKVVYFNSNHEDNIDTSLSLNPSYYMLDDIPVISIFKRKRNNYKTDGNPLIYALKNIKGWKFKNKEDILNLLKQFIRISNKISPVYDTIITVPSSNILNNEILKRLNNIIKCKNKIDDYMQKMDADDVYDNYVDWKNLYKDFKNRNINNIINDSFFRMEKENNNIFSFKYINNEYRAYITQTMIKNNYSVIKNAQYINDKNVLILDDTISSGTSVSEMVNDIRKTFVPKSLTVITLFSRI